MKNEENEKYTMSHTDAEIKAKIKDMPLKDAVNMFNLTAAAKKEMMMVDTDEGEKYDDAYIKKNTNANKDSYDMSDRKVIYFQQDMEKWWPDTDFMRSMEEIMIYKRNHIKSHKKQNHSQALIMTCLICEAVYAIPMKALIL